MTTNEIGWLVPVAFVIDTALMATSLAHGGPDFGSPRTLVALGFWLVLLVGTAIWLLGLRRGDD